MVKNKYDTLDNLSGEVLTDIRALADPKYQQGSAYIVLSGERGPSDQTDID